MSSVCCMCVCVLDVFVFYVRVLYLFLHLSFVLSFLLHLCFCFCVFGLHLSRFLICVAFSFALLSHLCFAKLFCVVNSLILHQCARTYVCMSYLCERVSVFSFFHSLSFVFLFCPSEIR